MRKRYTQEEKIYLLNKAIEAVENLDGHYPSFKNYVWSVQHILKGGEINNSLDRLAYEILKEKGKLTKK